MPSGSDGVKLTIYFANRPEVTVSGTNIVPVLPGDRILGRAIDGEPMLYPEPVNVEPGVDVIVIPLAAIRDVRAKRQKPRPAA